MQGGARYLWEKVPLCSPIYIMAYKALTRSGQFWVPVTLCLGQVKGFLLTFSSEMWMTVMKEVWSLSHVGKCLGRCYINMQGFFIIQGTQTFHSSEFDSRLYLWGLMRKYLFLVLGDCPSF